MGNKVLPGGHTANDAEVEDGVGEVEFGVGEYMYNR